MCRGHSLPVAVVPRLDPKVAATCAGSGLNYFVVSQQIQGQNNQGGREWSFMRKKVLGFSGTLIKITPCDYWHSAFTTSSVASTVYLCDYSSAVFTL